MSDKIHISFNASGWMCVFQFGVVTLLKEYVDLKDTQLYGTSAGATVATSVALNYSSEITAEEFCKQEYIARSDFKKMVPLMKNGIERLLPYNITYKSINNLCVICSEYSNFTFKSKVFKTFNNRNELVSILSASSHVPVLGGYLPHNFQGHLLYDGLFTDTHPLKNDRKCFKITWTPHCICGCNHHNNNLRTFAPEINIPSRWCFLPPDDTTLRLIYWHGYCQAMKKILRPDFPCNEIGIKKISPCKKENQHLDIEEISKIPLTSITDDMKKIIILNEKKIINEIQRRIDITDKKYTGFIGLIRYIVVILALLFPFLKLNIITQSLIVSGTYISSS